MWVKELRKMLGSSVELCIVGNKIDMEKQRHVQASAAEELVFSLFPLAFPGVVLIE